MGAPRRVLVVDDEALIALDLKRRLERAGYVVTATAASAADAIQSAQSLRPDVVLMDINLGSGGDGIDTAGRLRRELRLPVIFVTAHADKTTLERARLAEPFGYVVKPFNGTNFQAKIEMTIFKHALEEKLRHSERWLAETMRQAGDGIVTTSVEGEVVGINPAAELMNGRPAAELRGRPLCEVMALHDPISGARWNQRDVLTCVETNGICIANFDTAGDRVVECHITMNRDEETPLGMIVVLRDITERLRAAERERQLHKMQAISLLATGVGRELQEPLRTIAQHTEECIHDAKGALLRDLRQIYRGMSRAQALVHQLAEMGRQETTSAELVDVNRTIEASLPRLRKMFSRRQTFRVELSRPLPMISVEKQGLLDSLMTLLMSAQQAAGTAGWVELRTSLDVSGTLRIAVGDSGNTIPERARARVFEPYYHSRSGAPEGLSLALVHHFATVNSGSVETGQTAEGHNTFSLLFPGRGMHRV